MKQQILDILDKSTNNGMKADEIVSLIQDENKPKDRMLLTKYKVQELVENAKIDLDDLSQNVGAFLEDGIDDDSITLVYTAIDMLKEQIIDELGRVS